MTNTMKLKNKKGFTLTELIVVIVIIGILAAVLIPSLTGYITKANKSAAEQEASVLIEAHNAWLFEQEAGTITKVEDDGDFLKSFQDYAKTLVDVEEANITAASKDGFTYCNGKYHVEYDKTATTSSKFTTTECNCQKSS